jgi:hypothetical protein
VGVTLIVLGFAAMKRFHLEGMPQHKGDAFLRTEVGHPYQVNRHSTPTTKVRVWALVDFLSIETDPVMMRLWSGNG